MSTFQRILCSKIKPFKQTFPLTFPHKKIVICIYLLVLEYSFLGAFVNLQKPCISVVMPDRPAVCLSAWNSWTLSGRILINLGT
jgi:hypothetical protein